VTAGSEPPSQLFSREEVLELLAAQEARIREQSAEAGDFRQSRLYRDPRMLPALLFCLVAGLFLYCAWPGVSIGFDSDDVMNLEVAWDQPFQTFAVANLVPFTSFYRPAGAAYYRLCFALFGWRPQAFRLVTVGLLLTNLLLVYLLARRLTGSAETGVISAMIYSFHGRLRQIYMSNGTVYDVLCGTLTLTTLLYYIALRERRQPTKFRQYLLLLWLFTAAVNAKEVAAIVPALVLLYEWIYHPPDSRKVRTMAIWLWKHGRVAALMLLLAGLAFWGKQRPGAIFHGLPLYAPSFTVRRFFQNERRLLEDLFYLGEGGINTTKVVLFYTALFGLAAFSRRKHLWFAACFVFVAPLPFIFIPYRGFFVMYVPFIGASIYAAAILVEARDRLWRWLMYGRSVPVNPWAAARVLTIALLVILIPSGRNRDPLTGIEVENPAFRYIADTHDDILHLNEPLPEGARVLLLNCRYPDESWGPLMMMRLLYRDRTLWVDRPAMMSAIPDETERAKYDRIIDMRGDKWVVIRKKAGSIRPASLRLPR